MYIHFKIFGNKIHLLAQVQLRLVQSLFEEEVQANGKVGKVEAFAIEIDDFLLAINTSESWIGRETYIKE